MIALTLNTQITYSKNVFTTAWSIAREAFAFFKVGSVKQYFKEALKMAWVMFKEYNNSIQRDEVVLFEYMDKKLITNFEKNAFYECVSESMMYNKKEVAKFRLYYDLVLRGFMRAHIVCFTKGGKCITREILCYKNEEVYIGKNKSDFDYIDFLIRKANRKEL